MSGCIRRPTSRLSAIMRLAVLAAPVALTLVACSSGHSDPFTGYGKNPVDVAKALGTCAHTSRHGSAVTCTNSGGQTVTILATKSSTVQQLVLAMMRDHDEEPACAVILPGVIIGGSGPDEVQTMLGKSPTAFASAHDGRVECPGL